VAGHGGAGFFMGGTGESLINILEQALLKVMYGCRLQNVVQEILEALFNSPSKVSIQRLRLVC
jgi:hypothetical protein